MTHKLLQRQLGKSRKADGSLDFDRFCELVDEAYEDLYRDQTRTKHSVTFVSEELEKLNAELRDSASELKEKNSWFRAAIDNMSQGICLFDSNQQMLVSNDQFALIYGLKPEQMKVGLALEDLLGLRAENGIYHGEASKQYIASCLGRATDTNPSRMVHKLNNGQEVEVIFQPLISGGFMSTHSDITEKLASEKKIKKMARYEDLVYVDTLTGLSNRVKIQEELDRAVELGRQNQSDVALFFIDLDGFKEINDTLGHQSGDSVLIEFSRRLNGFANQDIVAGRLGGDEFLLVVHNVSNLANLEEIAKLICHSASEEIRAGQNTITISASVGIAVSRAGKKGSSTLLQNADIALYRAKSEGANNYLFFEEQMDAEAKESRRLAKCLKSAIPKDQFLLHYQPQIDFKSGNIVGYEALVRWEHPLLGLVPPIKFIELAEKSGQICELGEWVLRTACNYAVTWPGNETVSVNISPIQFKQQNITELVTNALDESGLDPRRLELEITESVFIQNSNDVISVFENLCEMGVSIALDDFGTGFSSLSYLSQFRFDKLKIDKSFIDDIGFDQEDTAIVSMIIGLGRSLNTVVIAEGIETLQQHNLLSVSGCSQGQGYLYGKPEPRILDLEHSQFRKSA